MVNSKKVQMQLRIAGLANNISEEELVELFSKIGTVESARVIRDITSGKSRGFGIVRMPIDAEAKEAIHKLNGSMLADKRVVVSRMPETLPGELEFREWLTDNACTVLNKAGLRDRQMLVDYGCGPGAFSIAAAKIVGRQGKVYALDVRPQALERLKETADREGLENVETMLLDELGVSIALADKSANVILVYDVLHEIQDKLGLLKELHRILKRGGLLSVFPMSITTIYDPCLTTDIDPPG